MGGSGDEIRHLLSGDEIRHLLSGDEIRHLQTRLGTYRRDEAPTGLPIGLKLANFGPTPES